jgi:acyl protein synthase/acyl-coA reductase rfbN
MTYEDVLALPPFGVAREEKQALLCEGLLQLTEHHRTRCAPYARMMEAIHFSPAEVRSVEDIPFLPVRLFKEMELRSVAQEDVFKTMTSSGTTGQQVSKIFLDRVTAVHQQKTLVRIVSEWTGKSRLPMLILDCPSVVRDRAMFSARGAGILGFSMFGKKRLYALNDAMELQLDDVQAFLQEHAGGRILLFGFTFMVWQYFYRALKAAGVRLNLSGSVLIHGGGWKKLAAEAVDSAAFRAALREVCGDIEVADYYGMVEQTGGICLECGAGHLHASTYSDVIVRRPLDFSPAPFGETGILEVVSLLPHSYPGHALLTEDEGVVLGEDDCPCGRKGKYFKVLGRLKQAELRGCSDTYAAGF